MFDWTFAGCSQRSKPRHPVEAVDVLAAELARMLHATDVSLLIANLSGTAAVLRMSHVSTSGGRTGGDTFDYSVDREYLYASVTDAMGHSVDAALLATLTLGSLRNTRRSAASPGDQANAANTALIAGAQPDQFVTGYLLRIRLADGTVDIVNAGHPPPYLLRAGAAATVEVTPGLPLGVRGDPYVATRLQLEVGDRLLIVTDGFLERNGTLAVGDILERSIDRHPREVVRELSRNVLAATGGNLRDDAAVLCIDWYGSRGVRNATGGASLDRATNN